MAAAGPNKPIRLRNSSAAPGPAVQKNAPVSGLFLVQFREPPTREWHEQLLATRVQPLRYVPDDAFVARFDRVRPADVLALPFVQTVRRFQPEHKVHPKLHAKSRAAAVEDEFAVAVLLSPRVDEAGARETKARFRKIRGEAKLRSGRVLRGTVSRAQLDALAASEQVLWLEPAPEMRLYDEVASRIVAGDGPPGQTLMQSLGYDGAGVTVAVADSGLDSGDTNTMHTDIQGRVKALFFYGGPGQLEDAADEHSHGTHVAGIIAGNGAVGETDENGFLYGLGVAPGASVIGQRIFDANGGYAPPPSFETLTRDAKQAGADIGSNSWGEDTQGDYDLSAMEFDELVRDANALALGDQPYILEFSAGNAGPGYQTVGTPAVAKNVIATGASQNDRFNLPLDEFAIYADGRDSMTDFSSRGPCSDGRIKPDLVAPGSWIASLRSVYANDDFAWWPISGSYMYQGGTSQAGPLVSGAAAVFVQYWRSNHAGATPSPALVKAALINSAADMDDGFSTVAVPNMDEGWGRVDLPALIPTGGTRNYDFTDQTSPLTNGGVFEKRVLVGSAGEPLKITLVYTDEPGLPAAVFALVNDLDLEVLSPDGHLYRGNRFEDGESVPDAPGADTINNVEGVHLLAPVPGEYLIRIRGSRVVEDARQDTVPVDQDFALVISGVFAAPGTGIVTFDRPVYRAPDLIQLVLVDYDLAGQPAANVLLRSGAEPGGELLALQAHGSSGLFTGAVVTAAGPPLADGKIQLAHGDAIEAVYADALPASNRVFAAVADLLPPMISAVGASSRFGQAAVSWNTDEAARGEVYYGPVSPTVGVTNRALAESREMVLPDVPPNSTVRFFVVAQDEAGNRSTNDNGGGYFTITNVQPPEILLLDSFADYYVFGFLILAAPPLSGYTDALDALNVGYEVFDARSNAVPSQAQLNSYRCVIWRVSDLEPPSVALAQRITNYVHTGGSLLIASMEAATRFGEAGLARFTSGTLRVRSHTEDQPVNDIAGISGESVGSGINTILDYSPYEEILFLAGTSDPSDLIVPDDAAAPVILSGGTAVGLRAPKTGVDLPGRVVFLSFPLDAVPLGSGIGNNRIGLLHNILNFLALPANTSAVMLDSDVYSLPGRAIIEVEDADLRGQDVLSVNVHSPQHTNQLAVTLSETVRPGLFRGAVLFAPTNTAMPDTYVVNANDTVQFSYFDASASSTVTATAMIETNAPVISGVAIEPGYLEAVVSWQTSKPADALVQYSESPDFFPKNLIAYDPSPATEHSLFLSLLKPGTNYYVRVTSRDRAGNTTTDDNGGNLYQFTTLLPLTAPWLDDIETNNLEWSTFAPPESEAGWTRGAPEGGETAHSGTNCWGSNLRGWPVSQMETYLFSPGVLLTGGNKATLRFWHNYDFLPAGEYDIQLAGVLIITNVLTPPLLLHQMPEDFSGGWEEFEFDLTPYLGNVVYIAWYHFLFSIDTLPRLGWLVDDVSITVETVVPGTLRITNNISQAVFALAGPSGRTGNGLWTVITNAAPGQYTIQFGEALHYHTPPPQTNTLAAGGLVTFTGNYTFPDVNTNGIPDGWELANFGTISFARTRATDTDGDGLSDHGEFVAGTDPNNPLPPFRVTAELTNGLVKLTWPSPTNFTYRLRTTTSLPALDWQAYSGWLNATGPSTSFVLPPPTNGLPRFFRVEAAPSGANAAAGIFRASAQLLTNGLVRLQWPSAPGHAYRILGSSNAVTWASFSDWIRASGFTTGLTLPPQTNSAPNLFRVEAKP